MASAVDSQSLGLCRPACLEPYSRPGTLSRAQTEAAEVVSSSRGPLCRARRPNSNLLMSDRRPEQNGIRPEYDFSRAIRGKHAAKLSVSREGPAPAWLRDAIQ